MLNKNDKIYVAGHRGLVGSAIVRNLKSKGYENVIGRTHKELDLTNQAAVRDFFETEKPDVVVLAAAKVGGINANNTTPAEFAYENMQIQCNVIECCQDLLRQQMKLMPLPRSPVLKCASFIRGSMGMILSAVCRRIFTDLMTTIICPVPM